MELLPVRVGRQSAPAERCLCVEEGKALLRSCCLCVEDGRVLCGAVGCVVKGDWGVWIEQLGVLDGEGFDLCAGV